MSAIPITPEEAALLQKENAELRSLTVTLHATVAELKAQLALMKQKYFGGGQGETLDKAQLLLAIEGKTEGAGKTEGGKRKGSGFGVWD